MKWIVIAIFLLPNLLNAAVPSAVTAQIEAIRREREVLIEEQKRLQKELEAINRESLTLGSAVKSLDTTKKKLNADIRVTQSKIASTNLNIKALESTMAEKESEIETHREAIHSAIQSIFAYDKRSLLYDAIGAAKFSDFWRDRTELEGFSIKLKEEVENLRETKEVLNIQKEEKEKEKKRVLVLQGELTGQKVVVEESQKAKEKLLAETKNKETLYQQILTENLARQKQFEADLFRLESELRINIDDKLVPQPRNGILSWPLDSVYITQRFGRTSGSTRLYTSGTHNGVDFRAAQGTPVKVMLGGIVEGAGNTDEQRSCHSYGRWILVKHTNGLSSVYAHLSHSLVSTGQTVETGQVIGYSGGTPRVFGSGYSTGPHLHVGLFASQGVSVRQFTTSRGCQQVFVPIADVRAYLDPLAYLPSI